MHKKVFLSGNEAVATALRQINPDVFPAFPITPSTEIPQYFSNYVSNGLVDTEFITVESEHSSMSAAMGASAAGARALTATSSAGLAFMWEVLGVAASSRLPVALAAVCRALTGPLNINCDHSDTMGARDSGWIQLYAEDNQEAYDNMVMAFNIAENKDVMLPIMICQDGFITSHAVMNMEILDDMTVKEFVGEREPVDYLLNPEEKFAVGAIVTGKVARMTDFGAFVEIEPGVDALLHVSQITKHHVEKPSDELKVGQEIEAKIVDFNEEEKKISLSIKALLPDEDETEDVQEDVASEEE